MSITSGQGGSTALFTSTSGAETGCSRATTAGSPELSAISAANGGAGEMYVDGKPVPIQSGGVGYSTELKPILASTGGHVADYMKYDGDGIRSDLNLHDKLPVMSAGARKRRNRMTRKLRRTVRRFTSKKFNRLRSLGNKAKKGLRLNKIKPIKNLKKLNPIRGLKKLKSLKKLTKKRHSFRNLRNKFTKARTARLSKRKRASRMKRMAAKKGIRPPFFAYGGNGCMSNAVTGGNMMTGGSSCNSGSHSTGYDGGSINNLPLSFGQSVGGQQLNHSALANPPPQTSYSKCGSGI